MAKVLLIDDQPDLLSVMHRVLTNAAHEVTAVADGCFVLDGSTGAEFDLVVTDMIMPGAEGVETLTHLRRLNPRIRVMAISGGGRIAPSFHLKLASRLGAVSTLEKPFALQQLVETVEQVLAQDRPVGDTARVVQSDPGRPGKGECSSHGGAVDRRAAACP